MQGIGLPSSVNEQRLGLVESLFLDNLLLIRIEGVKAHSSGWSSKNMSGSCQVRAGHKALIFQELGNGPFLRGLPHESTVRRFRGICRVPYIIFAQWNSTLAGCLMSPPCKDVGVPFGCHISSFARRNRSLRSVAYGIHICYPAYGTPIRDKDFSFKHCHIRAVGQSGAPQVALAEEVRSL